MRVRAHVFVVYVTTYKFFGQTSRFFIANIWDFKCQVGLDRNFRNQEHEQRKEYQQLYQRLNNKNVQTHWRQKQHTNSSH